MENFVDQTNYWDLSVMKDLTPLTRKKLVKAGISLDILQMTYLESAEKGVKILLSSKQTGPLKGLRETTIQKIVNFCEITFRKIRC